MTNLLIILVHSKAIVVWGVCEPVFREYVIDTSVTLGFPDSLPSPALAFF